MLNGLPRNWLGEAGIQASAKRRPYSTTKCSAAQRDRQYATFLMDNREYPSWENDAGQRVASLTGVSVFDIMRVPRGAALLMWEQWQAVMPRRSGEAPI